MPRETVRSSDYQFVPIDHDGQDGPIPWPDECRLGQVEVGWTKHPTGSVEIGTSDASLIYSQTGLVAQIASGLKEGADVEVIVRDFFQHSAGIWISLDREGINALIRVLRKARDGAWLKDE